MYRKFKVCAENRSILKMGSFAVRSDLVSNTLVGASDPKKMGAWHDYVTPEVNKHIATHVFR